MCETVMSVNFHSCVFTYAFFSINLYELQLKILIKRIFLNKTKFNFWKIVKRKKTFTFLCNGNNFR